MSEETGQGELFPSVITRLNESRGVISAEDLPNLALPPDNRSNIAILSGHLGVALCSSPASHSRQEDQPLEVYRDDFQRSKFAVLSEGLYIPYGDPRYKNARNLRVAILGDLPLSMRWMDGLQRPSTGVALGKGEYPKMVPYPRPLAARAYAQALDANSGNMNREEARETANRAAGHILEDKLEALQKLDQQFVGQYALLLSMHKDARIVWRTSYLTKNLDRNRKIADELIHDTVEIAAHTLGFSTPDTNAVHRAFTSKLYRRGSARELAESWRAITYWTARYIVAKRGKVNQSTNGCKKELRKYQPYLDKATAA